jgi:hypothetical protein
MAIERKLPVQARKGRFPSFKIEDILLHESETARHDCDFDDIQRFLAQERQQVIPGSLAERFRQVEQWQLVVPLTFDRAQLLFLGRLSNDRERIPIADAQATVYFHRGAEGGDFSKPRGKYGVTWVEMAGIFPDSNGDERILGAFYGADHLFRATHVHASFSDEEYRRSLTVMDSFLPATRDIPTPLRSAGTGGLITQAMIDRLPEPHRKVLSLFPNSSLRVTQIGGQIEDGIDFDQGIILRAGEEEVVFGLAAPLKGQSWTMSVPTTLERTSG